MSDHSNGQGAALLTMGADDSGFPLAAIFRTIHGRRLRTSVTIVDDDDTDPPSSVPPQYESVDPADIEEVSLETAAFSSTDTSEQAVRGAVELLRRLAPSGSDPRMVAEVVQAFAIEEAGDREDSEAWYRHAFGQEVFLTRPPILSEATRIEADFIKSTLGVASGSRILDVACGYGRITNHLAAAGLNVVGVDLSEAMLKKAQALAKRQNLSAEYVWGDMRDLEYDDEFEAVICTDSSFGFFSDADNLVSLRKMVRALKPNGRLVIDVLNRDMAIHDVPGRNWWEGDGCLIQEDSDFDIAGSRLRIKRLLVFSDGRQSETILSMRLYSAHELISLCQLVGLQIVELSGSAHSKGAFFCESSRRLVVTARKVA